MGSPVVVVRSSATAEDLAEASMAGQYETLLDISGEQDIEWTICDGRAVLLQSRAITTLADADAYREWLAQFGHRGPEEFDLAAPRWREQREEVRKMAAPLADGPSPAATHHARFAEAEQCAARLRGHLPRRCRKQFDERGTSSAYVVMAGVVFRTKGWLGRWAR